MALFRNGAYVPGTNQTFSTSTTVGIASNPVGASTGIIRVAVTTDTLLAIGNVTAGSVSISSMILPAGKVDFYATVPGYTVVAFKAATSAGLISITELQ